MSAPAWATPVSNRSIRVRPFRRVVPVAAAVAAEAADNNQRSFPAGAYLSAVTTANNCSPLEENLNAKKYSGSRRRRLIRIAGPHLYGDGAPRRRPADA